MDLAPSSGPGLPRGEVGYPRQTQAVSSGEGEQTTEAERTTIFSPHKPSPDDSEINNAKSTENSMLAILMTIILSIFGEPITHWASYRLIVS